MILNLSLFTDADKPAVQKEFDCILDCTMRIEIYLSKGLFEEALAITMDLKKSVQVLQQLIKKKEEQSKVNGVVKQLLSIGVSASTVGRLFENKKAE